MIVVELFERSDARKNRDELLSSCAMWQVPLRSTIWRDPQFKESKFFSQIPEELLMIEKMQRHGHNWCVTTEKFEQTRSLMDFFRIVAIDDATP
jgi:hypothetical protein